MSVITRARNFSFLDLVSLQRPIWVGKSPSRASGVDGHHTVDEAGDDKQETVCQRITSSILKRRTAIGRDSIAGGEKERGVQ